MFVNLIETIDALRAKIDAGNQYIFLEKKVNKRFARERKEAEDEAVRVAEEQRVAEEELIATAIRGAKAIWVAQAKRNAESKKWAESTEGKKAVAEEQRRQNLKRLLAGIDLDNYNDNDYN